MQWKNDKMLSYGANTTIYRRIYRSHNRPEFQRHRYPGISLEALRKKIRVPATDSRDTTRQKVEKLSNVLFRISV